MNLHRLAELRSIALHAAVAERLAERPDLVDRARARIATWRRDGRLAEVYASRWAALLDLPLDELAAKLVEDSEEMRELRQATPFAGVVPPRERFRIWREVAERAGR